MTILHTDYRVYLRDLFLWLFQIESPLGFRCEGFIKEVLFTVTLESRQEWQNLDSEAFLPPWPHSTIKNKSSLVIHTNSALTSCTHAPHSVWKIRRVAEVMSSSKSRYHSWKKRWRCMQRAKVADSSCACVFTRTWLCRHWNSLELSDSCKGSLGHRTRN